ncbi:hypothetical protein N9L47_12250 [Rhodobacteraceae bacterium]|nr:hypothetical protein [Paracoccaceae bacterium]
MKLYARNRICGVNDLVLSWPLMNFHLTWRFSMHRNFAITALTAVCLTIPLYGHAAAPTNHPGEAVAKAYVGNGCKLKEKDTFRVLGKTNLTIGELNVQIDALTASGHLVRTGAKEWTLVNWDPC